MKPTRARPQPAAPPSPALRRAEILEVLDADAVLLRASAMPTAEVVRAEIAVPGYLPAAGDGVLVAPGDGAWFVLGVLGAARRRQAEGGILSVERTEAGVELRVPAGDLTLSAPGRIRLRAETVETEASLVHTAASEVVTRAGKIEADATRIVERAGDVYRQVEGLAELQAGRARTLVEGTLELAARRTTVKSDEDTVIDGQRVLLG
jgi:hypothetical protein